MNNTVQNALAMLGYKGTDKVTGMKGIVTSVGFDLYGCVQVVLNPGLDKDGKHLEHYWLDAKRVTLDISYRVMDPPDYMKIAPQKEIGAAEKPLMKG